MTTEKSVEIERAEIEIERTVKTVKRANIVRTVATYTSP